MGTAKYKTNASPRQYLEPWECALPPGLAEDAPAPPPSELEMQALWFEGYFLPSMTTQDGQAIEILDPGDWNHGAGPDFDQAACQPEDGTVHRGPVELHLQPLDWENHGHHTDPAYDGTILHVVWEDSGKRYFPATSQYRHVPQVVLSDHLPAPWPELRPHAQAILRSRERPLAQAGPCADALAQWHQDDLVGLLRAAGRLRLQRKAQRLAWRAKITTPRQALWEAMAEGLGYAANQRPMRLLAQRLPVARLDRVAPDTRTALCFGLSGFLPTGDLASLPPEARQWARPVWDAWWRRRAQYDHAILRRAHWKLTGLRPWNRPERRLAILPGLAKASRSLLRCVERKDATAFLHLLEKLEPEKDSFWHRHASLKGKTFSRPHRLLGEERMADLVLNVFWPMVARSDPDAAEEGWRQSRMAPNKVTAIARQRLMPGRSLGRLEREALVQQGLLQVYRDYCCASPAGCASCTFPDLLRRLTG